MTLEEKKGLMLECVKLGMDFFSSAILAECTDEEIEVLEEDAAFTRRIRIQEVFEEKRLLEKHNTAIEEAVIKGSAAAVQWKLEKINPGRWGNKEKDKGKFEGKVTVNMIGRFPDGNKC